MAVLIVAASLRLIGITWGVPSPDYPHHPFHPDEAWAMGVLGEADFAEGDFVFERAHKEGSLLYYLLSANALALRSVGVISAMPCCFAKDPANYRIALQDYRRVLISGRVLVAAMDVAAVLMVFLIVRRLTDPSSALAASALYAILPFEVVHAHFMRTHTPANLMILLVLYVSLGIRDGDSKGRIALTGLLAGLATAMRFTTAVVILVPALMILGRAFRKRGPDADPIRRGLEMLAASSLLGLAALFGLFLGDSPLFLSFEEIRPHLAEQLSFAAQDEFASGKIFDLDRVGIYLSDLIPHALGIWMWLLLSSAAIYALFLRRFYPYTIPWLLMNSVYLYFMAKGYLEPIFARAALNLLPVFALIFGIAMHDAFGRLRRFRRTRRLVIALLAGVGLWTLILDGAYLRAMVGERDPRYQVRQHLFPEGQVRDLSIGLYADDSTAYFMTRPAFFPNHGGSTRFAVRSDFHAVDETVDYVALTGYHRSYELVQKRVDELGASGRYFLDKRATSDLSFLGIPFDYRQLPADMQYSLFEIYLMRSSPAARDNQAELDSVDSKAQVDETP